jgi:hypothetical protein
MNNPMYTDRQVALQAAVEYCMERNRIGATLDSYAVVRVAERYRKFLEEGIVEEEPKTGSVSVNGGSPMSTTTGGWRPRVGNG